MSSVIPDCITAGFVKFGSYRDYFEITISILLLVAIAFVVHYAATPVLIKANQRLINGHSVWDEALVYSLRQPLVVLIWFITILLIIQTVQSHFGDLSELSPVTAVRELGITIIITWFLFILINRTEYNLTTPSPYRQAVDKTTASIISRLLNIIVFFISLMITFSIFSIDVTGLVALGGVGSFIIGFAAKDLLSNLFGGMMIFMDRSFAIGDWIHLEGKKIEGTVEHIGWRSTMIRKIDKRPLYVPNSLFLTEPLENPSRMLNRQIKELVQLRYKDSEVLNKIMEESETMLSNHPDIDNTQTISVRLVNFSEIGLNCQIYCFTRTIQTVPYLKVRQDVLLRILQIVSKYGAEVVTLTQHCVEH